MLSALRSIWTVLRHTFRPRVTVQYPEKTVYLAPRYRGRIVLSRDPDGQERCVACYLCAGVCPVDCISLQATEDESLYFLRVLRRGVPDLRHPVDARYRDERVQTHESGL